MSSSDNVKEPRPSIFSPPHGFEEGFWVFGYGSLMWKPGFPFVESASALVRGFHRSLCIYSVRHRGTIEKPGLVLGLDHGGSCRGVAFRVAATDVVSTRAYLTEREQMNMVYRECWPRIMLAGGRRIQALAYVVNRKNRQYAGRLAHEEIERLVLQGHGESGACREYVLNTLASMAQIGVSDHALDWLGSALSAR
ncbi:Gamma-glutamyl cyclotransferase-like [Rhabdaerophilaceae bacterium]